MKTKYQFGGLAVFRRPGVETYEVEWRADRATRLRVAAGVAIRRGEKSRVGLD
jgi:hypothetical protein